MKRNVLRSLAAIAILGIGFFIGMEATSRRDVSSKVRPISVLATNSVRANLSEYKFINPLLFTDNAKSTDLQFQALAQQLSHEISVDTQSGQADSISVYFRDLNSGNWTGVNENDLYTPSSMLKVVAMMAALKVAEENPSFLSDKLHYRTTNADSHYYFPANDGITDGYYSVQELIGYMIKYSDNDALDALVANKEINAEFVQAYSLFRLPQTALTGSTTDFMSPKSYSTIFRTLYNSSFFGWDLSEQVLSLLSQTTFKGGIVAGVPEGTVVSHKFGENTDELHDCGIVYHPSHPYLLCVMTRGTDLSKLETVIRGISSVAWNFVDSGSLIKTSQ